MFNKSKILVAIFISLVAMFFFNNCGKFSESENNTLESRLFSKTTNEYKELKVALMGDTDIHEKFTQGLELAKREGTEVMMINGDFAYAEDGLSDVETVYAWRDRIERSIDFNQISVIGSVGNHDIDKKDQLGHNGEMLHRYIKYFGRFRNSQNQLNEKCTGQSEIRQDRDVMLMNEVCTFGNVSIVASAIGITEVFPDSFYENELKKKLSQMPTENWKLAGYHYTLKSMNMAGKGDQTTHTFFDIIRQQGAIGVQAHTHTAMASCPIGGRFAENSPVRCLANFENDVYNRYIEPGIGIYLDSSVSGRDVRDRKGCSNEGSSNCDHLYDYISYEGYHIKNGAPKNIGSRDGILFVDFNKGGDPSKAYVYFKNFSGNVIFDFVIHRNVANSNSDNSGNASGPLSAINNGQYRGEANGRVLTKVSDNLACRPQTLYGVITNKVIYDQLSAKYDKEACESGVSTGQESDNTANNSNGSSSGGSNSGSSSGSGNSETGALSGVDQGHYRETVNGRILTKVSETLACKPSAPYEVKTNKAIYEKLSAAYNREACQNIDSNLVTNNNNSTEATPSSGRNLASVDLGHYWERVNGRVLTKISDSLACSPRSPSAVKVSKEIYDLLDQKYNKAACSSVSGHK